MARMSEQEFLDACVIPDKTPIICKGKVIGYTMGENDCKKPIKAAIYPHSISVHFNAQHFIEGVIDVTDLAVVFDDEGICGVGIH